MRISDYDFDLPAELIAQRPVEPRDAARMLVLDRGTATWSDAHVAELPSRLGAGDTLVVNNTRVFPARLVGCRAETGGKIELFLVQAAETSDPHAPVWETLARPAKRLRPGARLIFGDGKLHAEVIDSIDDTGRRLVRFHAGHTFANGSGSFDFDELIDEIGRTPLPPYIKRGDDEDLSLDRARYQTVYAKSRGSIAAPTAGLHLTATILEALRAHEIEVVEITLHVGYGTFAPITAEDLSEHRVAAERFTITRAAADVINSRRANGGRTVAVGTTTARALESAAGERGHVIGTGGARATGLTITPGYKFRAVDRLLTNFHLPKSSLLVLVGSFAGRDLTLAGYAHAVRSRYRFYSYGDCMLIV